jgi:3-isopropylmalate dehydratase small subunit
LLKGLDDIGTSLQHADSIDAYEKAHPTAAKMYETLDVKYYTNGQ